MLGAMLAVFLAFHSGLDSPDKYLFTIPGTNITGDVNLDSPVVRAEDQWWLHEAYAERDERLRNVGLEYNSVTGYFAWATNDNVILKDLRKWSGFHHKDRLGGLRNIEHGITDLLTGTNLNVINGQYVGDYKWSDGNLIMLNAANLNEAVYQVSTCLCEHVEVYDPCFTNFGSSVFLKLEERKAVFCAMGMLNKVVKKISSVSDRWRVSEYSGKNRSKIVDTEGEIHETSYDYGPVVVTDLYTAVCNVQKDCTRSIDTNNVGLTSSADDLECFNRFMSSRFGHFPLMSDGAYFINMKDDVLGVSAKDVTVVMILCGYLTDVIEKNKDVSGHSKVTVEGTNGYFAIKIDAVREENGKWNLGSLNFSDLSDKALGLMKIQVPADDYNIIDQPKKGCKSYRGWKWRMDCEGFICGIEFEHHTKVEEN